MDSLLEHNTFGIDATCSRFVEYASIEELCKLLPKLLSGDQRWMHIGGGSNLLFLCEHYDGIVLHSQIKGIEVCDEDDDCVILRVGAGEDWDAFVAHCVAHGWYGLENLSFIPGEVGASAVQNVGAYGVEAGDLIETVEGVLIGSDVRESAASLLCGEEFSIDVDELAAEADGATAFTTTVIDRVDCKYAYRSSVFKHELKGRFIVTHVWYKLSKRFMPVMTHAAVTRLLEAKGIDPQHCTADEVRGAIIEVRKAKLPDPKETGSAGSFFMNPVVPKGKADVLLAAYPTMPHYPAPLPDEPETEGVKIPAGWLIEKCGWKGKQLGAAGVHHMQALVLINCGGAKGSDVERLAFTIQADVRQKFGIDIHPEVLFIQ